MARAKKMVMHAEIQKVGSHGSYAVDILINEERFRVKYFEGHRVNPLRDAQEFTARIGEALKKDSTGRTVNKGTCIWTWAGDDETVWSTECGEQFQLENDYTLAENKIKFCCYCGGKLVERR